MVESKKNTHKQKTHQKHHGVCGLSTFTHSCSRENRRIATHQRLWLLRPRLEQHFGVPSNGRNFSIEKRSGEYASKLRKGMCPEMIVLKFKSATHRFLIRGKHSLSIFRMWFVLSELPNTNIPREHFGKTWQKHSRNVLETYHLRIFQQKQHIPPHVKPVGMFTSFLLNIRLLLKAQLAMFPQKDFSSNSVRRNASSEFVTLQMFFVGNSRRLNFYANILGGGGGGAGRKETSVICDLLPKKHEKKNMLKSIMRTEAYFYKLIDRSIMCLLFLANICQCHPEHWISILQAGWSRKTLFPSFPTKLENHCKAQKKYHVYQMKGKDEKNGSYANNLINLMVECLNMQCLQYLSIPLRVDMHHRQLPDSSRQ